MTERSLIEVKNAIDWHTKIATDFDEKYSKSRYFKERYAIWSKLIEKYSDPTFQVLDLGCGSGALTFYLAERNRSVIGLDGSVEMLKICHNKKGATGLSNVNFINCSIASMKQNLGEKADMVICSSVLEYLDDLDEALGLICNVVKKGGLLIFSMPNRKSLYRRIEPIVFKIFGRPSYYKYIRNVCTIDEIKIKLKKLDLNLLQVEYYGKTPFISGIFHRVGLASFSDNLFIVVVRLAS